MSTPGGADGAGSAKHKGDSSAPGLRINANETAIETGAAERSRPLRRSEAFFKAFKSRQISEMKPLRY